MEDSYVVLGSGEGFFNNLNSLNNKTVGVLENDKDIASAYLSDENVKLATYNNLTNIFKALSIYFVDYIIVPRYYSLDRIMGENQIYPIYFNRYVN
jgi:hypothetical protein